MKIVFMGTPDFARTILEALVNAGHEITAVYTQPDKPKGRSGALIAPPVKEYALSKGFKVYQPERIKRPEEVEILKTIEADMFVVAAFGQFLSEEILNMPKYGCVNVHGSLLPKLRGAAPIQRSIMNGDAVTGVTVMRMDKGMDSGDMIAKSEVAITETDDETTMYEKLAEEGAKLLVSVIPSIENGTCEYIPQNHDEATFAPMLKKEEGLMDFTMEARILDCRVRGMSVWPGTYTYFNGKILKVYKTALADISGDELDSLEPGMLYVTKKNVYVKTGLGMLELLELQPEGKKRMPAMDFARGAHLATKDKLGQ